jgi:23S rRNA (cytosine1962-C5)-methyltransferase
VIDQVLSLKKGAEKRLKKGSLWIYSNEVDIAKTPLKQFTAGQQVQVEDAGGKALGLATVNPATLICGRIYSTTPAQALDRSLIVHRLKVAQSLRERFFTQPFYRLLFAESDFLPGLVIDRFADVFVIQITTAGMEAVRDQVIEAVEKVFSPAAIILRNDTASRDMEGLEKYTDVVKGSVEATATLEENATRFVFDPVEGQKTGWFYDHRQNRQALNSLVKGKRVLDVFSYVGGWGVQALAAGAKEALCVDSSQPALDLARENARLNECGERLLTLQGNALEVMKSLQSEKEKFDVVVLDPPAFIKRQKDVRKGEEAYHAYNQLALRLLSDDGLLVSASCSMHLPLPRLQDIVRVAGRRVDRQLQLVHTGFQGPDHPVHPAMPETAYLKALFVRSLFS